MFTEKEHPAAARRLLVVTALVVLAAACTPTGSDEANAVPAVAAGFTTTGHYTTKTPYAPPAHAVMPPLPEGFRPLMVQLVARHGSRPLSSPDDDDLSLQVWRQAAAEGALTPLGERLGPVLEDLRAVHERLGYGAISARGAREQHDLALRLVRRQPALFEAAVADERRIRVLHSGQDRAAQSAMAFLEGLLTALPMLAEQIDPPHAAPAIVYFNDAAETPAAAAYRQYRASDPRLQGVLDHLKALPETREMSRRLLEALYAPAFVDRLEAGQYRFTAAADPDDVIEDAVDAAASLYSLYAIAVNVDLEAELDFGRFIDPTAAAWLAMVDDAESFYERGPAFADSDVTWRAAEVLLEDFLASIEAVVDGTRSEVAVLRFTHAQALMPFAALLGIEGAYEGLPEETVYRYDVSDWRSERVSPMAANVQWDVYADDAGLVLVLMLHQERPVRFAAACRPWGDGGYFYALNELRRCYDLPRSVSVAQRMATAP